METYEVEESLEKNRISNISTVSYFSINSKVYLNSLKAHSNIGYIAVLCLNLSLLLPLANDPKVNNYVIVLYVIPYLHSMRVNHRKEQLGIGFW